MQKTPSKSLEKSSSSSSKDEGWVDDTDLEDPSKEDSPESKKYLAVLRLKSLFSHLAVRHMRALSGGKSGARGAHGTGMIYRLDVNVGVQLAATTAGGVFSTFWSGAQLTAAPDFAQIAPLFDIARVVGFMLKWVPRGAGQAQSVANTCPLHTALICVGDPDANGAVTFVNLASRYPLTDKPSSTVFTRTDKEVTFSYKFPVEKKVIAANSGAFVACMGQWTDVATSTINALRGGLLIAANTEAFNVSLALGVYNITFMMEWSTRL